MRYAMIMAGGAGTRLWPMSRKDRPKQLIRFIEKKAGGKRSAASKDAAPTPVPHADEPAPRSLLEVAAHRLEGLVPSSRRFICTAESYRDAIHKELPEFDDEQILGEPAPRDTVNAVGFAAAVLQKLDKNAIFAVLTADHVIEPEDLFRERMDLGFKLVEADPHRLVTFSIKPTYPATGFGYVERGTPVRGVEGVNVNGKPIAFQVERFVEKPDLPRAQAYLESGSFSWNSGMFVWKASTFLEALKRFKPESHAGMMEIQEAWGTRKQQEVLSRIYPTLPKISVDFAVMEPASKDGKQAAPDKPADKPHDHAHGGRPKDDKSKDADKSKLSKPKDEPRFTVCTVLMDVNWLDVGSWPSYAQTIDADAEGNRIAGAGAAHSLIVNGKNNLIVNAVKGRTVAVLGADDLVVVQTEDATLVMPRAKAEELKTLHGMVDEKLK